MRSRHVVALGSALTLLVVATTAGATEPVEDQLKRMEERLLQMEDRLQATTAQLDAAEEQVEEQSELLESAGLAEGRGVGNGLTDWVNEIEIGGWVAASYNYNFNHPNGSVLNGANTGPGLYPFHPDANSFALDQFWIELERPIDEENRAGFAIDLSYGKGPGLLADAGGTVGNGGDGFSGNDFNLYQAYVQYLAPIGPGVEFKFGKFGTVIGAEVMQSPYNFNISRGNVYNLFQPFTHTGVLASTEIAGVSLTLGGVNETRSFDALDVDLDNGKALLWNIGYGIGDVGLSFAGAWGGADSGGSQTGNAGDNEIILDWIISWDPMDNLSTYVNVDYIKTDNAALDFNGGTDDVDGFGVSWATRYGITDRAGVALRFEYLTLDNFYNAANLPITNSLVTSTEELEVYGVTATADYLLTDHLMLRGELRYDYAEDGVDDNTFIKDSGTLANNDFEDDQFVFLIEAIYKFDGFGE